MSTVVIKMGRTDLPGAAYGWGTQRVTVSSGNAILWEGYSGETAALRVVGPTRVRIYYHTSATNNPGCCDVVIDPYRGHHYLVKAQIGMNGWQQKLTVHRLYRV